MTDRLRAVCSFVAAALFIISLCSTLTAQEEKKPTATEYRWGNAEFVFTGKLTSVEHRGTAMSWPPIHMRRLHVTVEKPLRGPLQGAETILVSHSARQHAEPVYPRGKVCLLAARKINGSYVAEMVLESDAKTLELATLACSLPLGWQLHAGQARFPLDCSRRKGLDHNGAPAAEGMLVCAKTGRPAPLSGSGVVLEVEHVPSTAEVEIANPDGDGEYKITVRNATDKPLVVPALLSDGKQILWEESLAILCQNKAYICPGCKGVSGKVEAKTLAPRESVSTVVNSLRLDGPEWPRGGYRIEFRFCLGELSQTKSFYYLSRHHDAIRAPLAK